MSVAGAIRAGAAYVELLLEQDSLLRGLANAEKRLRSFATAVDAYGRSLLRLSAGGAAFFGAGAKAFGDFDRQMRMVSTMLKQPDQYMAGFRSGIRGLSQEFGESTATLSKGLYDILSASVPPEHAMGVLRETIKSARGGITDTATSTTALLSVLNAYGLSADHAGQVSDMLFQTVQRGVLTFPQLAEHIGDVTAIAAQAGLSMDEMGASLATMTRNGLQADTAVTALQNIMKDFLEPQAKAIAAARQYGVELNSNTLRTKGLLGVMQALAGATPEQMAEIFPNIRALRGILALRGDLPGLAKDMELMAGKAGATDTAFRKMAGGLNFAFSQLWQTGVGVFAKIGEAIAGPLEEAAKLGRVVGKILSDFIANHRSLVRELAMGTVALALPAGLLGARVCSEGGGIRIQSGKRFRRCDWGDSLGHGQSRPVIGRGIGGRRRRLGVSRPRHRPGPSSRQRDRWIL